MSEMVPCLQCGEKYKQYPHLKGKQKYCSVDCYNEARKAHEWVPCEQCGELFYRRDSDLKYNRGKYCSIECRGQSQRLSLEERTWSINRCGYVRASGSGVMIHPMAKNNSLYEHWYVWYEHAADKESVIDAREMGAAIHHKDGNKANNNIENLELWLSGRHPIGISESNAIEFLRALGYTVIEPEMDNEH